MKKYLVVSLCLCTLPLGALEVWRFPEAAGKNVLFADIRFSSLSFESGFSLTYPEFSLDYMLPLALPFSAGLYLKAPDPQTNFKSFGTRLAYHLDIRDRRTDLYALYVFEWGFLREGALKAYNDEPPPARYYDFRAGVRRLFGRYFCLQLETAYKLWGVYIGVSVRLN